MRISIDHTTRYEYQTPVRHSTQCLRLVPQSNRRQRVLDWQLYTPGTPLEMRDGYGNVLHLLTLDDPVTEIVIRAMGTVETSPVIDEPADDVKLSPLVFLRPTPLTRAERTLIDFAEGFRRRAGTLSGLRELAHPLPKRGQRIAATLITEARPTKAGGQRGPPFTDLVPAHQVPHDFALLDGL